MRTGFVLLVVSAIVLPADRPAAAEERSKLVDELRQLAAEPEEPRSAMLLEHAAAALRAANERETAAWRRITSLEDWAAYRDKRITALRASLGMTLRGGAKPQSRVTGRLEGSGYRIENSVFESSPGLLVTANLYEPSKPPPLMPGILLCHSHHAPKSDGELQEMAINWARSGCTVLVMDVLGHGERRQHPFAKAADYPEPYKVGRQDYHFRYNLGMQLQLIGQSLTGWIVRDLMRGVDLLLERPGIDPERIILLGSVAGGGDPAAVAGALDPRIAAIVAFNFGGPQPETRYPLPDGAEDTFEYAGSGSFESTRNLPFSARDGFLPWVIVGSIAPRRFIYGHEFVWGEPRDPVWKRLQVIFSFYDSRTNLVGVQGTGRLSGQPPEASHCNNIGRVQLQGIHLALARWFEIRQPAEPERKGHSGDALKCLTGDHAEELSSRAVYQLADEQAAKSLDEVRAELEALSAEQRRLRLQQRWQKVLGDIQPRQFTVTEPAENRGPVNYNRVLLHVEPGIDVPVLVLLPTQARERRVPMVVGVSQAGAAGFLKHRADEIANLLQAGARVCLPDLRGTGESALADDARDRTSPSTDISASYLMLGTPLIGQRLRDLRCVLRFLRSIDGTDTKRIALWGDSFSLANLADQRLEVPYGVESFPAHSEPLGGTLVLLAALFEPEVAAVYAAGGLSSYQSVLRSPFCYLPHDMIVPDVFSTGDLTVIAASLGRCPLRISRFVDGRNRLTSDERPEEDPAAWLLGQIEK